MKKLLKNKKGNPILLAAIPVIGMVATAFAYIFVTQKATTAVKGIPTIGWIGLAVGAIVLIYLLKGGGGRQAAAPQIIIAR